jgi:hypothetical protein
MKNQLWSLTLDIYLEVVELAQKHGKKSGDSMLEEFQEIRNKYPERFQYVGETEKDIDLLTGDLREEGLKVFNIKEEERKNQNDNH